MTFLPSQIDRRAELYFQFSQMTAAGIGIPQVVAQLKRKPPSSRDRNHLALVEKRLQDGATLSDALHASGSGWLLPFELALLKAAELSGRLPRSFMLLAEYYRERARLLRELISHVTYPVIVFHVAVLVFPTSVLTNWFLKNETTEFIAQKLGVLIPVYAAVAFMIYACQAGRAPVWRDMVDRILGWVPVLGTARRALALSRLSASLEGLISAGVTIIEAWEIAADACGSSVLRSSIHRMLPSMRQGQPPSQTLNEQQAFPEFFANYYHSGEISGKLDESLESLRNFYQSEGSRGLRRAVLGAAGIVFAAVMIGVAANILSFWMGHFQQIQSVTEGP